MQSLYSTPEQRRSLNTETYVLTSASHDPQVQAQKPPPKTFVPSPVTVHVINSLNKYFLRVCSLIASPPDDRHVGLNRRAALFCSGRLYLLLCEATFDDKPVKEFETKPSFLPENI